MPVNITLSNKFFLSVLQKQKLPGEPRLKSRPRAN